MIEALLLGTGAVATAIGAGLGRSGVSVTLAGTWPESLAALARDGATVEDASGRWSARVGVARTSEVQGPVPLVLVLAKSWQTEALAAVVARVLDPAGLALTLQNGIGHRETLARAVGADRVVAGSIVLGAAIVGPGVARVSGPGEVTLPAEARLDAPAVLLERAGLHVLRTDAIDVVLWCKLAANCAINALTATLGVPNGALLEDQDARATLVAAAREVGAVAAARGLDLGDTAGNALQVAARSAENRSSMLQDVERGRPTEVEALNGWIVQEAARLGVPAPVNARLLQAVRERSA